MDSDRVLVLDAGRLLEYDEPHVLLQNEKGLFASMVKMTGKSMASNLREMARIAHEMRNEADSIIRRNQLRDLQGSFINTPKAQRRIDEAEGSSDEESDSLDEGAVSLSKDTSTEL